MDIEKYSDPLDIAARNENLATEDAIREHRLRAQPQQLPDANGHYLIHECLECGEDIGLERLKVATKNLYCVSCVEEQERKARR